MSVSIIEMEQLMLDRLKEEFEETEVAIELYPDNPNNYKLKHPKGAVLIHYNGETLTPPVSEQQTRTIRITVPVLSKDLRSPMGAENLIDRVRHAICDGLTINGAYFYLSDVSDSDFMDGVWTYDMTFILEFNQYIGE